MYHALHKRKRNRRFSPSNSHLENSPGIPGIIYNFLLCLSARRTGITFVIGWRRKRELQQVSSERWMIGGEGEPSVIRIRCDTIRLGISEERDAGGREARMINEKAQKLPPLFFFLGHTPSSTFTARPLWWMKLLDLRPLEKYNFQPRAGGCSRYASPI